MWKILSVLLVICLPITALSQSSIERKIIVNNHQYYYVSYDEHTEYFYLHIGSMQQSPQQTTKIELPWGASYDFPLNQFMWDIHQDTFYCVNRLPHSLNDQTQNIKKIAIQDLQTLNHKKIHRDQYVMDGIDQYAYINNIPHNDIIRSYTYLDTYYADMCIDNAGKLVWVTTIDSNIILYTNNFASKFQLKTQELISSQPLLILQGNTFLYKQAKIDLRTIEGMLQLTTSDISCSSDGGQELTIINKNNNTIQFIQSTHLSSAMPFKEMLRKYSYCKL